MLETLDPVVDGKSRKARQLKLHVIRPEEEAGRVYDIGEEVTVGRAPGCGVPIDYDSYSSSLHARLFRLQGDLWAEDLGSTNGTWVNTIRIDDRTKLQKGDLLQIGGTVLKAELLIADDQQAGAKPSTPAPQPPVR